MTTRDTPWPEGTPCWLDLAVDDFAQGQAFYSGLFGWEIPEGAEEFGGYSTCTKDGRAVAGLAPKMEPDQPSVWTTYLAVDDVDAAVEKVRSNGGQVIAEPLTVAEFGRMALVMDPAGAVAGFWQPGTNTGVQVYDEPGSLVWTENLSRGWKQNREFFRAVFGWDYEDMSGGEFEYATFKVGDQTAGGIGQMGQDWSAEVPPHWNNYFKVADVDKAVDEVKRLGGQVEREPWDTPFGRMASVADNQGAHFMLMGEVGQEEGDDS